VIKLILQLRLLAIVSFGLVTFLVATPSLYTQDEQHPLITVKQNGYFSAEHGHFEVKGNQLHVYSALVKVPAESGGFERVPHDDDRKKEWKGETFYHDVYELQGGRWVQKLRGFSQGGSLVRLSGPCDHLDQLDLSRKHSDLSSLLDDSQNTKIKQVMSFVEHADESAGKPIQY
jgi:hypothetical protein